MSALAAWWRNAWLAPGGRGAAAVVRIAIATSILWTLQRLGAHGYAADPGASPDGLYRPLGIWMLFPGEPSPALLELVRAVAWASTLTMLVGLCSRASHAVSLVTTLALASYDVAFTPTWSHHNSMPLVAHLAFLGARGGDAWSIDAWLRRRAGRPALDVANGYQWSLRLVQLAIALVFFAAASFKLYVGGFSLDWALSDNLRHQLLARFDRLGLPRTAAADWLLASAWRWKAAALGNLTMQLVPIAAVFLPRRPRLRALCGVAWCIEVVMLGVVMDLWNLHWLPLAAAFIDWDRVLATWPRGTATARSPRAGRLALGFVAAFVVVDAAHAFGINQRTHAYPFSAFPMFGEIRARPPYDRHQPYEMIGGRIELFADRPLRRDEQGWIDARHPYRVMWHHRTPGDLHRDLDAVVAETRARFPTAGVRGARLWLTVYVAPAYPAPARLDPVDLGVIAEQDDGGFRSAIGTLAADARTVTAASGIDLAGARLVGYQDDRPEPQPLPASRAGDAFVLADPLAGDPIYVIAAVGDRRWLIAQRSHRGF